MGNEQNLEYKILKCWEIHLLSTWPGQYKRDNVNSVNWTNLHMCVSFPLVSLVLAAQRKVRFKHARNQNSHWTSLLFRDGENCYLKND